MRAKQWEVDMWLLYIYINRKPCIGSPMTPSPVTLSDLESSKSRSLRFQSLIPCKVRSYVSYHSPLIGKHIWRSIGVIAFDLVDFERSVSRSLRFWKLISCKGAELGHMLLLHNTHYGLRWQNHKIIISSSPAKASWLIQYRPASTTGNDNGASVHSAVKWVPGDRAGNCT